MISIKNVSKSYDGKTKAVNNLSLEIRNGEIFGFLGPNGAGKTTTLKMITGILPIDSGEIVINGYDIAKDEIKAKKSFGYVSDDPNAFLRLKGIEYLNFMADLYDVAEEQRIERISEFAKAFELTDALNAKIMSYSHGMRQKIVLMGAIFT
jgi:ABC-2 type transport system ATP-binding protein